MISANRDIAHTLTVIIKRTDTLAGTCTATYVLTDTKILGYRCRYSCRWVVGLLFVMLRSNLFLPTPKWTCCQTSLNANFPIDWNGNEQRLRYCDCDADCDGDGDGDCDRATAAAAN